MPVLLGAVAVLVACTVTASGRPVRPRPAYHPPPVRHVFVINLENKGYAETFGSGSKAPYLAKTLRGKGALLTRYYGVAHHSLPNYLAQVSGQGPNAQTQGDCAVYSRFHRTGTVAPGQAVGNGCVYPRSVRTVADQLVKHGLTWRGYMQDMGRGCRHPRLGTRDRTQGARVGDQYATKHNPFVYFRSITAHHRTCARRDVGLRHLTDDLRHVRTTRNLSYITPNLCNDGHDSPCVDGRAGGLRSANAWLRKWVPRILRSPAFAKNGLLVVTFDEADGSASACCGEGPGPNAPMPGIEGPGGGRVGAVVVSPFVQPGTRSRTAYNHYSLLRTIEDYFGLGHLGYAKRARHFGADVYGASG
ncbi:MAG TPA: alkaline phosphatase family protein [Nocardioidaceae bacterium]|nr:alkaline phosphatase family protein [Nocardioidaceae bacterium]